MTLSRKLWLVGMLASVALCLVPSSASAVVISVNSNTDLNGPNDDLCELREAITSANTDTRSGPGAGECDEGDGSDSIVFSGAVFNGTHPGSTIGLASANGNLPTITEAVTITGCSATPNSAQPCAGIERAPSGSAALTVFDVNANNVAISGVAITTPSGVPTRTQDNVTGFTLKNTWYGMKLDQSVVGTGTVTLLGDGAVIGGDGGAPGTSPADRNIFATTGVNTIPGLRIQGNNNQVRGNYFGVKADGTTLAQPLLTSSSQDQIVVNGAGPPTGNSVGGTIDSGSATECDDACNVIAGADGSGIDLEGGGTPADMTTIAGNHIGLDKTGTVDLGNAGAGISVGAADNTTIGGLTAAEGNLISGNGTQGVDSGAGSTGMSVGSNYLGLNLAGTAAIPNETQGAVVHSGIFVFNRLGGTATFPTSGGVVIGQVAGASAVTVQGNVIGVGTGGEDLGLPAESLSIESSGANSIIGGVGPGEGNVIGNARGASSTALFIGVNGVSVQGSWFGVDADGTTARPNDGTGIQIADSAVSSVIGGTTGASENVISNNALDAIEILGDGTDMNQVLRNFGSNNGGLFLDLAFDGATGQGVGNPFANGPNEGIQAPAITAVNSQTIAGTADPNSVVRIYRTNTANGVAPADIIAFAGVTTADGAGNWSLTFAAELPVPGQVTANQTNPNGSSSEFSNAMSYLAPPPPPSAGGTTPVTPTAAPVPPKKCKKGQKLKKGKCVKKKRKKKK